MATRIIPAIQDAQKGWSLEPRNSSSAWATSWDLNSKKEKEKKKVKVIIKQLATNKGIPYMKRISRQSSNKKIILLSGGGTMYLLGHNK